jgi:hypothetical protein
MMMRYFSCSGGTGMDSTKSVSRHITQNLCFLHSVGSTDHVVHSGASGVRDVDELFAQTRRR